MEEGLARLVEFNPITITQLLIKYRKPSILIFGDSITKCLLRYVDVWDRCLGKYTVNLGIGGDKVEDVIWELSHGIQRKKSGH